MGVIARMMERRADVVNPKHPRDPVLAEWFGGENVSSAGEDVTPATAMRQSAVLSAVRYYAETHAALPLFLYRRGADPRVKDRATEHPLYERLHSRPNRWQTKFQWVQMLDHHLLLRGNAYSELLPSDRLPPYELVPRHPDRVRPYPLPDGRVAYEYTMESGQTRIILRQEMLHIPFMPSDEDGVLKGKSVLAHARETIGRALAADKHSGRFFAGDATPGGVLTHPGKLSEEATQRLGDAWDRRYSKGKRGVAVLKEGMKFEPVSISPDDAQFIETMQFNVTDIARIFRVPPHKIADLSRATFSNIEQQSLDAVVDLLPWLEMWEEQLDVDLLLDNERQRHFFEHSVEGLLRGDSAARGSFYNQLWMLGALSPNDIRALENMPPIEGGDRHYVPLNVMPITQADQMASARVARLVERERRALPAGERRSREELLRLRDSYRPLFEDAGRRVLRREADTVERQFKRLAQNRTLQDFRSWVLEFYEGFSDTAAQAIAPVALSYAGVVGAAAAADIGAGADSIDMDNFAVAYSGAYGARHAGLSRAALHDALTGDAAQSADRIDGLLGEWRDERPAQVAAAETVQAGEAFKRETWRQAGVTKLRWVSAGGCPLCQRLDGQVVGIEQEFVGEGDLLSTGGETAPLKTSKTLHPPLHRGCDCSVVPETGG